MRATLKALSYPEILDKKNGYRLQRAAVNAAHPHVLRPFYKIWDREVYAGDHNVPVRIFSPDLEGTYPALLFFHGGGWVTGNIDSYDKVCTNMAKITRHTVISVDYRLAPEYKFPAAPEDCYQVARELFLHSDLFGIKPEQITLIGDSAGGNLAAVVSLMARDRGEDVASKVAVSTIVSSSMPDALARDWGFEMRRVLTGFKYIGDQIDQLKDEGEEDRFLMGFEESYGYLVGTHARDKDAIVATMLCVEMASYYAEKGMDLYEAMDALYQKYGYYLNGTVNASFPGAAGAEKMAGIMDGLRTNPPAEIAGYKVVGMTDYATGPEMPRVSGLQKEAAQVLPPANVIEFRLEDDNKVIFRPSGTEPKVKAYLFSKGATRADSEAVRAKLEAASKEILS